MFKLLTIPFVVLIIALIVIAPLAYVWALNTLFPVLNLEYSFVNWLAMLVLHSFFHNNITIKK